jgi:hypothetical protein
MQSTKAPYTTHHWDLYGLIGWHSLHIRRQTHWLQVIYKSMLGKPLPYLSSLVTITTPIRSTPLQVYLTGHPQSQHLFGRLSFQFSAALWLEGIASRWSWKRIFPSLTLNISYPSSYLITAAVHSPSVNSPSNQPTSSIYCYYLLFWSFSHHYFYLHIIICISITPVLIC